MARVSDEYVERITSYLNSHGITDFHFERRAKHRAVAISYEGRSYTVVFPLTGSDWRGPANTISTIRHVLGLFQPKALQADNPRLVRRRKAPAHLRHPVSPTDVSQPAAPRSDKFLGPLMTLKARLEAVNAAAGAAQTAVTTVPVGEPVRIALRTPWLGKRIRYATI